MGHYDIVVAPDAAGISDATWLKNNALFDKDATQALYIVVRHPGDMRHALRLARHAAFDIDADPWWPAFLCHNVTKNASRNKDVHAPPSACPLANSTLSAHWQVLCFVRQGASSEAPMLEPWKPKSHQVVTVLGRDRPSILPLLDAIADHLAIPVGGKRAVVFERNGKDEDEEAGATSFSEFDVVDISDPDTLNVVRPARRFNLSSARKSRMLKAYLTSPAVDVWTLKHDLAALESYFADRDDYDPNRKIIGLVPPRTDEDFVTCKTTILGEVRAQLKLLRRRARNLGNSGAAAHATTSKNTPKKRRTGGSASGSGIASKSPVTQALRDFLVNKCGIEPFEAEEGIPRTEVVRAIPKYIKGNGLATGRDVEPDEELRKLLPSPDFNEKLTYFSVFKHINHNFLVKPKPSPSPPPEEVSEA